MKSLFLNLFIWLGVISSLGYMGLVFVASGYGGWTGAQLITLLLIYFLNMCILIGIYFKPKNLFFLLTGFFYSLFLMLTMLKKGMPELEKWQIFNFSITEPFVWGSRFILRPFTVLGNMNLDEVWSLYIASAHFFYSIIFLFMAVSLTRSRVLSNQ